MPDRPAEFGGKSASVAPVGGISREASGKVRVRGRTILRLSFRIIRAPGPAHSDVIGQGGAPFARRSAIRGDDDGVERISGRCGSPPGAECGRIDRAAAGCCRCQANHGSASGSSAHPKGRREASQPARRAESRRARGRFFPTSCGATSAWTSSPGSVPIGGRNINLCSENGFARCAGAAHRKSPIAAPASSSLLTQDEQHS